MTTARDLPVLPRLEFVLSESNLGEGGRDRYMEVYLNIGVAHQGHFGREPFKVLTPNSTVFECRASGATAWSNVKPGRAPVPKNLRSVPADLLGRWLARCEAQAGDRIVAHFLEKGLWLFRHVPVDLKAEAQKSPEAFDWEKVFAAAGKAGDHDPPTARRDEEGHYRGSGRRGAR